MIYRTFASLDYIVIPMPTLTEISKKAKDVLLALVLPARTIETATDIDHLLHDLKHGDVPTRKEIFKSLFDAGITSMSVILLIEGLHVEATIYDLSVEAYDRFICPHVKDKLHEHFQIQKHVKEMPTFQVVSQPRLIQSQPGQQPVQLEPITKHEPDNNVPDFMKEKMPEFEMPEFSSFDGRNRDSRRKDRMKWLEND